METYAPKMSRTLMTPEPHYIPGYAGYCPQLKFNMGRSYGQLTAQLLTCPDVKHSRRLVLSAGRVPATEPDTDLTLRSSRDSNAKHTIPGYTGFIPKSRNYFACSYSETCRKALTEFYQDRSAKIWQQSACHDLPAVVDCASRPGPKPPLTPKPNTMFSYKPLKPFTPVGNPYLMDDNDPHKYLISGFTGHVPKSRFLFGKGYPISTNQALVQFRKQQQGSSGGNGSEAPSMPSIYPTNRGVVPSFTGHIPGYKFMYGRTFGQLSHNALATSGIKRTPSGKVPHLKEE